MTNFDTPSVTTIELGINHLSALSDSEFGVDLQTIICDRDEHLAFKRVGRLMAVWIKQPFAESHDYDPDWPLNWAKSPTGWEIRRPITKSQQARFKVEYDLLVYFANEWDRPLNHIAEYNIFLSLCRHLRPVVCGESKTLTEATKISKDLRKAGYDVSMLTTNEVIGAASVTIATYLVQAVSFLSLAHLPIVTGGTLLLACFGRRKLCRYLSDFEKTYEPIHDRFASSRRCGSTDTNDGEPCRNRVRDADKLCWIHKRGN